LSAKSEGRVKGAVEEKEVIMLRVVTQQAPHHLVGVPPDALDAAREQETGIDGYSHIQQPKIRKPDLQAGTKILFHSCGQVRFFAVGHTDFCTALHDNKPALPAYVAVYALNVDGERTVDPDKLRVL
jgi:hypothetical protein